MYRKILISIILLVLLCVGCAEVQMSPRMAQITKMSAINVAAMNKDCQDGNSESCVQGLAEAAKTLELIVEAM